MRYVELTEPVEVEEQRPDGRTVRRLFTLLDLADFAVRVGEVFNEDFAAAVAGQSMRRSCDKATAEWREATGGSDGAPGVGVVLALEDDTWRRFCEFCEKPKLSNGHTAYPFGPASKLVPMIENLKAAKTERPARKGDEPKEPEAQPAQEQPS